MYPRVLTNYVVLEAWRHGGLCHFTISSHAANKKAIITYKVLKIVTLEPL